MFRKLAGLFGATEQPSVMITRVYSEKKRNDLYRILHASSPRHNERLWLAGFLKYAGYRMDEVEDIIGRENHWSNYNPKRTREQLRSVFNIRMPRSKEAGGTEGYRRRRYPDVPPASSHARSNPDQQYNSSNGLKLDTLNREFLRGASEVVSERPGPDGRQLFSWGRPAEMDPRRVPLYRTIEGRGHLLAVLDIDADNDLGRAWRVMQRLMGAHRFRWAKYSGNRGFHGIDVLRYADRDMARRHIEHVCALVDMEGLAPDPRMFHPRQLIRAFSLNLKSGRCSVPVRPGQTLEEILESAGWWGAG
jgi:hypothetical protein